MEKEVRVGIFDSGIGGLTVLSECVKRAPQCTYYYYGDNAHAPYGERSVEEITGFVRRAMCFFRDVGVDAAVLACNTATAVCAEEMRREFCFPIIGMEPAVKPAGERCKNVLILATPRTVESERLKRLVSASPQCAFTPFPAHALAGAIEAHFISGKKLTLSDHLPEGEFDSVVLGCTHYVWFRREISAFYGGIPVFDGNAGTVNRLVSVLELQGIGTDDHRKLQFPNKCLTKNLKIKVHFVGSGGKINENIYKSERMF